MCQTFNDDYDFNNFEIRNRMDMIVIGVSKIGIVHHDNIHA